MTATSMATSGDWLAMFVEVVTVSQEEGVIADACALEEILLLAEAAPDWAVTDWLVWHADAVLPVPLKAFIAVSDKATATTA